MNYTCVHLVFFSATDTTKGVVSAVASGLGIENMKPYDLLRNPGVEADIPSDELAVFGMPVYAGRIPQVAAEALRKMRGNRTPAILVCVYGNREFEDALVELEDLVKANNFTVVSAGAFIAQHSIFPQVAHGRPDREDLAAAVRFGKQSRAALAAVSHADALPEIRIRGNRPYRIPSAVPLKPRTGRKCNACGKCARECPVHAIDAANPSDTNKELCISCAHCIHICPVKARKFGGLLYRIVSRKFGKKCAVRLEPYTVLPE